MHPSQFNCPSRTDPIVPASEPAPGQTEIKVTETTPSQDRGTSPVDPVAPTSTSAQAEIEVAVGITLQGKIISHIQSNTPAPSPVADSAPHEARESILNKDTSTGHTATITTTPIPSHAHPQASTISPVEQETATHVQTPVSVSASSPASSPAPIPTPQCLIQFDTYEWLCFNQVCRKLTSPFDGSTVICPRCGPNSKVRYCSKTCLFSDILTDWGLDCGRYTLTQKVDPLTIDPCQINILPFIPSLTHIGRPERHRQLVHHSLDDTGDYFLFSDFTQWRADGCPGNWPAHKYASGNLVVTLNFTDKNTTTDSSCVPARHVFDRFLRICFLIGGHRIDMTYFLFRMNLGRLEELGWATADISSAWSGSSGLSLVMRGRLWIC